VRAVNADGAVVSARLLSSLVSLVALAAVSSALAGCGGGSPASAFNPTSGSAPSRAQALSYANAVNLQASDLHSAVVASQGSVGKAPKPGDVELDRCYGAANPYNLVLKVVSPTFRGTTPGAFIQVNSTVEVEPAAALAAHNLAAIRTSRGLACLKRFLPRALSQTGVAHYGPVTITPLPALPSVPGSFGIRLATTVSGPTTGPIPFTADELGFATGPAEVSLTATSAPQPIPTEDEERLLAVLYRRAQAHSL